MFRAIEKYFVRSCVRDLLDDYGINKEDSEEIYGAVVAKVDLSKLEKDKHGFKVKTNNGMSVRIHRHFLEINNYHLTLPIKISNPKCVDLYFEARDTYARGKNNYSSDMKEYVKRNLGLS